MDRHERDKPWWTEVAEARVEHYPDRASVQLAEIEAIRTEHPKYNIQHNNTKKGATPVVDTRAAEGDAYPVRLDDAVAVCQSNGKCRVGIVTGVFRFGVKISLFNWLSGVFDREVVIRYKNDEDLYDMDPLGRVQTLWEKNHEQVLEVENV